MRQYPSDIIREEYKLIREDLEGAKKTTRSQSVYYYFRVWSEKDEMGVSVLDKVLQKLVKQIRNEDLRRDKTTFGIVDAQSVQNADTAEAKGYDAGKSIRNQAPRCRRYNGTASCHSRNNR